MCLIYRCVGAEDTTLHEYLSNLPYVLVHILKPGGEELCLQLWESGQLWESSPVEKHHPETRRFLEPGSQLRGDIDLLEPDCNNATKSLQDAPFALSLMPMDDSIAEFPRAQAKGITDRGQHARFAGVASSMRLKQIRFL